MSESLFSDDELPSLFPDIQEFMEIPRCDQVVIAKSILFCYETLPPSDEEEAAPINDENACKESVRRIFRPPSSDVYRKAAVGKKRRKISRTCIARTKN